MEDKNYEVEVAPETPFPGEPIILGLQNQPSQSGNYSPSTTKEKNFPRKRTAVELLSTALNTKSRKILQEFALQDSGGFKVGDFKSGISGDLRITPNGLTARNISGITTFAIDGDTGDAIFKGQVRSGSLITGAVIVADETGTTIIDGQGLTDGSSSLKNLSLNKITILSCFESVDGWTATGTVLAALYAATVRSGAVSGNVGRITAESGLAGFQLDPNKNPFFQTSLWLPLNTSQTVYIVAGADPDIGDLDRFGFKIVDGTLYAHWTKGATTNNVEITGITVTELNIYRAFCETNEQKIYFYVNGVFKYVATTDFPTTVSDFFFTYYIQTNTAATREIRMVDFLFEQDR